MSDGVYRRTVDEIDFRGIIEITNAPRRGENYLLVRVPVAAAGCLANMSVRVRRLFDLDADVSESSNIAGENPDMVKDLSRKLDTWIREAWKRGKKGGS